MTTESHCEIYNGIPNLLTSLAGSPTEVGGDFICMDNKVQFRKSEVLAVCEVNGNILV